MGRGAGPGAGASPDARALPSAASPRHGRPVSEDPAVAETTRARAGSGIGPHIRPAMAGASPAPAGDSCRRVSFGAVDEVGLHRAPGQSVPNGGGPAIGLTDAVAFRRRYPDVAAHEAACSEHWVPREGKYMRDGMLSAQERKQLLADAGVPAAAIHASASAVERALAHRASSSEDYAAVAVQRGADVELVARLGRCMNLLHRWRARARDTVRARAEAAENAKPEAVAARASAARRRSLNPMHGLLAASTAAEDPAAHAVGAGGTSERHTGSAPAGLDSREKAPGNRRRHSVVSPALAAGQAAPGLDPAPRGRRASIAQRVLARGQKRGRGRER